MTAAKPSMRRQLLAGLDEAFDGRGWHGPTLWASLRGVTPACAAWRPGPARHNIWELAVHAAYWKHVVVKRMTGASLPAFGSRGTNWFARPAAGSGLSWPDDLARLKVQHDRLRETIARLPEAALTRKNARGRETVDRTVRGIAAHDVYHAGQIQLLKRMWQAERAGGMRRQRQRM